MIKMYRTDLKRWIIFALWSVLIFIYIVYKCLCSLPKFMWVGFSCNSTCRGFFPSTRICITYFCNKVEAWVNNAHFYFVVSLRFCDLRDRHKSDGDKDRNDWSGREQPSKRASPSISIQPNPVKRSHMGRSLLWWSVSSVSKTTMFFTYKQIALSNFSWTKRKEEKNVQGQHACTHASARARTPLAETLSAISICCCGLWYWNLKKKKKKTARKMMTETIMAPVVYTIWRSRQNKTRQQRENRWMNRKKIVKDNSHRPRS